MQNNDISLYFISTENQLAVVFTKLLDKSKFNKLMSELEMLSWHP